MFTLDGIKYFKASEVSMFNPNIPEALYQNIVPTIIVLDKLREEIGVPIYINSSYRSPAHNKSVGGSPNSLHMQFNALDFTVTDKTKLKAIYDQLCTWDALHFFKHLPKPGSMGLGIYKTFIHLDTRATLNRKSPARWQG